MRSNSLRRLVKSRLSDVCESVYYRIADTDAMYPHIVFRIKKINTGDLSRKDYAVYIDLWDRDTEGNMDLADRVEDMFQNSNDPQDDILPTFFLETRSEEEDADHSISHIEIVITAQLYERS